MNRKIKLLALGAAAAATIGLGAGLVTAQTDDPTPPRTCPTHTADMDEMHSHMSQQMQGQHTGMHEHMSETGRRNMHGMP